MTRQLLALQPLDDVLQVHASNCINCLGKQITAKASGSSSPSRTVGLVSRRSITSDRRFGSGFARRAAQKAGVFNNGPHMLRQTFCSHLAMRSAPARAIQELAGHQDLTTTQRYMHLSPAALDRAIRLLDCSGIPHGELVSVEQVNWRRERESSKSLVVHLPSFASVHQLFPVLPVAAEHDFRLSSAVYFRFRISPVRWHSKWNSSQASFRLSLENIDGPNHPDLIGKHYRYRGLILYALPSGSYNSAACT